ncbi:MAG: HAD-IB family hydrolase [Parachlamydia sp.]|nr:HAD-IB family hydrolase [Parachlamydia sp.]
MPRPISLFDLDHTLLTENSSYQFGLFRYHLKDISRISLVYAVGCYGLHKAGLLSMHNLHHRIFQALLLGAAFNAIEEKAERFVREHLSKMLYRPAFQRLQEAQSRGHHTVILSSSPDFLITPIARYFQVDEWAATPYHIDSQNRFSAVGPVLCGEGKKNYLERLLQQDHFAREEVFAYSDSHLDLPLLQAAGHPVAVNPDRRLRLISQHQGWEII